MQNKEELYTEGERLFNISVTATKETHKVIDTNNATQSFSFMSKAANLGHPHAMFVLYKMYSEAIGVKQNYEKAGIWLTKAAHAGDEDALLTLVSYTKTAGDLHKEENCWDKAVFQWTNAVNEFEKAIDLFNIKDVTDIYNNLSHAYENGKGVEKNIPKAIELLEKSIKHGDKDAMYALGCIYYKGDGVGKDILKAYKYFKQSNDTTPNIPAKAEVYMGLGVLYREGKIKNPPADLDKSVKYLNKAIEYGSKYAKEELEETMKEINNNRIFRTLVENSKDHSYRHF